jgi:Tol biopolymer transport system component/DNA-binding winged helix-turn-helix (wHTH) protein
MTNDRSQSSYVFGPFKLDRQTHRLFKNGQHLPLPRKRYDILLLLIENAGTVMSKEKILQAIWPNQIIEEANLTQHIYVLRRMIEEDSKNPLYIMTIPGSGYQFSANVELVDDTLAPARSEAPVIEPPAPSPAQNRDKPDSRRGTQVSVIILVLLLLSGVLLGVYLWRRSGTQRKTNINPTSKPLLTLYGLKKSLTYSRDGRMLAFTSENESSITTDIYVKMIGQSESIRLTSTPEEELDVAWSPDGQQLAFLRWPGGAADKYKVVIIPALGGEEKVVAEAENGIAWSPDGKSLAIGDNEGIRTSVGIYLLSLEDGTRRPVSRPPTGKDIFDNLPRFSPDGQSLAYVRWVSGRKGDIYLTNLVSGESRQLTFDQISLADLQFSDDGRRIFFVSNRNGNQRLWEIPVEGGNPSLVTSIPEEIEKFSLSHVDNSLAYTQRSIDTAIEILPLPASSAANQPASRSGPCLINSSRADDSPVFSPDGRTIVFISNRTGFDEIWITNSDCTRTRQLTSFRETGVGSPRWSPDGTRLIFDRHVDGQSEIFLIEIESRLVTRLTNDPASNFLPSWAADGRSFYFCTDKTGRNEIWRQSLTGGIPTQLTSNGGFESYAAPDGKTLYFTHQEELWTLNLENGAEARIEELTNIAVNRYWYLTPGSLIYVPFPTNTINRLDLRTRKISQMARLPGFSSKWAPGISISPDEKLLVGSYINYRFGDIIVISNWN